MQRLSANSNKTKHALEHLASALQSRGFVCSARTVGRRMQHFGLRVRYAKKYRRTTDSNYTNAVAPNHLDREFIVSVPNRVWVGE
jgi:putative transposase